MFADKLNEICRLLELNNTNLARLLDADPSYISRLRSGARTVDKDSAFALKLASAILSAAESRSLKTSLYSELKIDKNAGQKEAVPLILSYLFKDEKPRDKKRRGRPPVLHEINSSAPNMTFSERLDIAMSYAHLSNVRLSQLINVDASLISRYHSGLRTPRDNSLIAEHLADVLYAQIGKNDKTAELAAFLHIPEEEYDAAYFREWLYAPDKNANDALNSAEKLLSAFDSYSAQVGISLPKFDPESFGKVKKRGNKYFGYDGFREAVIRFLSEVVSIRPERIMLYSDQGMDWMTGDPAFFTKWMVLMNECVKNGTRIRIIHNINRRLDEMHSAIAGWLPLYMSGMIESYYAKRTGSGSFSHTLFLCPGHCCIRAMHVRGTEQSGLYDFITDIKGLEACRMTYDALFENTSPLVKITESGSVFSTAENCCLIQNYLSIETMPHELVKELGRPAIEKEWQNRQEKMKLSLKKGSHTELLPFPGQKSPAASQIPIEKLPQAASLFYTPKLYKMHIKNIIHLLEKYESYELYLLPMAPFANIKIDIRDDAVKIVQNSRPDISFIFTQPLMCNAFSSYAESLKTKYSSDRKKVIETLKVLN